MTRPTQRDIIDNRNIQPIVQEIKDKMDLIPDNELIITLLEKIEEVEKDTEQFTKKGENAEITGTFTFTTPPIVGTPAQTGNPVPLGYLSSLLDKYPQKEKAEVITGGWHFDSKISGKPGELGDEYATVSQIISPTKDGLEFTGKDITFKEPVIGAEAKEDNQFTIKSQVADKGKSTDTTHTVEKIYNEYYYQTPATTEVRKNEEGKPAPNQKDIVNWETIKAYIDGSQPSLGHYLDKDKTSGLQVIHSDVLLNENASFTFDGKVTFGQPVALPEGSSIKSGYFTGDVPYLKLSESEKDELVTKKSLKTILSGYSGTINYTINPDRIIGDQTLVTKKYVFDLMSEYRYVEEGVAFRIKDNTFTEKNVFQNLPTVPGTYIIDGTGQDVYTFPLPYTQRNDSAAKTAITSLVTHHFLKDKYYDKAAIDGHYLKVDERDEEGHQQINQLINFNKGIEIQGKKLENLPSGAWELIGQLLLGAGGLYLTFKGIQYYLCKDVHPVISDLLPQTGVNFSSIEDMNIPKLASGMGCSLLRGATVPAEELRGGGYRAFFAPFYSEMAKRNEGGEADPDYITYMAGMGGFDYTTGGHWTAWNNDLASKVAGPYFKVRYEKQTDEYPLDIKSDLMWVFLYYINELPHAIHLRRDMDMMSVRRRKGKYKPSAVTFDYNYYEFGIGHESQNLIMKDGKKYNPYYVMDKALLWGTLEPNDEYKKDPDGQIYPFTSWADIDVDIGRIQGTANPDLPAAFQDPDYISWTALHAHQDAYKTTYHNKGNQFFDFDYNDPEIKFPAEVVIGLFSGKTARHVEKGIPTTIDNILGYGLLQDVEITNELVHDQDHPHVRNKTKLTQVINIGTLKNVIDSKVNVHPWTWPPALMHGMRCDLGYIHDDTSEDQDVWSQGFTQNTNINITEFSTIDPDLPPELYDQTGAQFKFIEKHYCKTRVIDTIPRLAFKTGISLGNFKAKEKLRPRIGELSALDFLFNADIDNIEGDLPKRESLGITLGHVGIQPENSEIIPEQNRYTAVFIEGWPTQAINSAPETINTQNKSGVYITSIARAPGQIQNREEEPINPFDPDQINNNSNSNDKTDELVTVQMLHNIAKNSAYSARAYYIMNDGTNTPMIGFSAVADPCQDNLPLLQLEAADKNMCLLDHPPTAKINCDLDVKQDLRTGRDMYARVPYPLPEIKNMPDNQVPVVAEIKPIAEKAEKASQEGEKAKEQAEIAKKAASDAKSAAEDAAKSVEKFKVFLEPEDITIPIRDVGIGLGKAVDPQGHTRIASLAAIGDTLLQNPGGTTIFNDFIHKMLLTAPTTGKQYMDALEDAVDILNFKSSVTGQLHSIVLKELLNNLNSKLDTGDPKLDVLLKTLVQMGTQIVTGGVTTFIYNCLASELIKLSKSIIEQSGIISVITNKLNLEMPGKTDPGGQLILKNLAKKAWDGTVSFLKAITFIPDRDATGQGKAIATIDQSGVLRLISSLLLFNGFKWGPGPTNDEEIPYYEENDLKYKVGPIEGNDTEYEVAAYTRTNINLPDNHTFEVWSIRQKNQTNDDKKPLFCIANTVSTNGENIVENNTAVMGTVLISDTKDNKQDSDDITDSDKFFATHAYVESHGSFYKVTDSALYNRKQLAIIPSNSTSENTIKTILAYPESITGGVQGGIAVYNSTTNHKAQLRIKTYKTNNVEKSEILFVDHNNNEHPITINTITVMPDVQKRLNLNDEDIKGYKIVGEENVLSTVGNGILMTHYYVLKNGKKVKAWSGPVQ